ncbi:hypothetical protein AMTRI_Chr13g92840 [Amborella trichopoda]
MASKVACCGVQFWLYLLAIIGLVTFAGLMAGLTLGLMSLGLVDLEVLIKSGQPKDRKNAAKIFPVVKNQHLLLCTLLIGNSLAMEALPIFLDMLVPSWAAILISVTLILMFGEILPQAICSRYGMSVGAIMAPVVRVLLAIFFPVAYPISKILDGLLGKGHAVLLRRAELKTFMDFHGDKAGKGGDLSQDETTIISGALDLTQKTAKDAMTPISKTFSLDLDGILDVQTLNLVMSKGHSRIPVHSGNPTNIIGLILVKNLLTINPKDDVPLRKMTIRKIPRVSESMPLYDMLNEFQKGHSHISVVVKDVNETAESSNKTSEPNSHQEKKLNGCVTKSLPDSKLNKEDHNTNFTRSSQLGGSKSEISDSNPVWIRKDGEQKLRDGASAPADLKKRNRGSMEFVLNSDQGFVPDIQYDDEAVGIITMEDVIEELLQEEILDETDEYINVHNR